MVGKMTDLPLRHCRRLKSMDPGTTSEPDSVTIAAADGVRF